MEVVATDNVLRPQIDFVTEQEVLDAIESAGIKTPLVLMALEQSKRSHTHLVRDNGASVLNYHVFPIVMELIDLFFMSPNLEEIVVTALMHDTLEDDDGFTEDMLKEYGNRIYTNVKLLSKTPEEAAHGQSEDVKFANNRKYVSRIAASNNPIVIIVKLADRKNNLTSNWTIQYTNPQKFKRYVAETAELFLPIAKQHSEYFHSALIELVEQMNSEN